MEEVTQSVESTSAAPEVSAPAASESTPVTTTPSKDTASVVKENIARVKNNVTKGAVIPSVDEWKPNYKVKAYGKEYEIPEDFRSYINKDNEKKFKEVFERTFTADEYKSRSDQFKLKAEQMEKAIKEQYSPISQRWEKLQKYMQKQDFDSLFAEAGLKERDLQEWMLKKLQLKDLPPEQQQVYNENRAHQQRLEQLESENNQFKSQLGKMSEYQRQAAIQQRNVEFDSHINQPGVVEAAKAFDERLGQPGAFKIEVLKRAVALAQVSGRDPTIQECVDDAMKAIGWNPNSQPQAQQNAAPSAPKPTLPNISGKAASPVAQKIKSMADLRKLKEQINKSMIK